MKETIIRLSDDISGGEADRTVTFTFDGVGYEIDLNADNSRALQNAVAPFIAKARRVGGTRKTAAKKTASRKYSLDLKAVREWAVANGHAISNRGRIPAGIVDAFHAFESGMQSESPSPVAVKKTATKKAPAKKAAAKKAAAKKAPAKKSAPMKKTAAKKTAAKASAAKSAPAQRAALQAPAKKSATKRSTPAQESPAEKSGGQSVPTSVETPAAVEAVATSTEPTSTATPETASM